jgi:hypothetical protein
MIVLHLVFLCLNSLLSTHFHLNLFLLHMFNFFNVIFLFHFALPPDEFTSIFQTHLHLLQSCLVLLFFFVD